MHQSEGAGSSPETIEDCEATVREFDSTRQNLIKRIMELRDTEDVKAGRIHAQDIFRLQQEKLRLDTEIHLLQNRINRFRAGQDR
jgi:predicted RNase H-like nuclease (RuvC/YqgF family)